MEALEVMGVSGIEVSGSLVIGPAGVEVNGALVVTDEGAPDELGAVELEATAGQTAGPGAVYDV